MSEDLISRRAVIDALNAVYNEWQTQEACSALEEATSMIEGLPTVQSEGWMERNKERILQAGMKGQEVEFRIGGRLFAIREKAQ